MFGCHTEVPVDRFVILGKEAEATKLVHRPCADRRIRDVADVRHVEAQQSPDVRFLQLSFDARQAFRAQTVKMNALLPIHAHSSKCFNWHISLLSQFSSCYTGTSPCRRPAWHSG